MPLYDAIMSSVVSWEPACTKLGSFYRLKVGDGERNSVDVLRSEKTKYLSLGQVNIGKIDLRTKK